MKRMPIKYTLLLTSLAVVGSASFTHAQNEFDAAKYAKLQAGGTARSLSIGGAAGSLGGDFSATSVNPAGLGLYRSSELTITPTVKVNNADASYLGNSNIEEKTKFNLDNFGLVINTAAKGKQYQNSAWKSQSIAFGFNRLADFNGTSYYSGRNNNSSYSEMMEAEAQNAVNQFGNLQEEDGANGYLGYQAYVLNDNYQSVPYLNVIAQGGSLIQEKYSRNKGHANEWTISYGANYKEQLLLGVTLGLVDHRYETYNTFTERDASNDKTNGFNYFRFTQDLSTRGTGVNLKFGGIYIPTNNVRIGAAIHTPTWNTFTDIADYHIVSDMEDGNIYNVTPKNVYSYDYTLRTPWKAVLSGTVLFQDKGFLTADYEYVGYNNMRYGFTGAQDYERFINNNIKDLYTGASNVRVGAEANLNPVRLRVGFSYYGSPYKNSEVMYGDRMNYSAGIGYRNNGFFMDLGYIYSTGKDVEYPYLINNVDVKPGVITTNRSNIALTLGVKF